MNTRPSTRVGQRHLSERIKLELQQLFYAIFRPSRPHPVRGTHDDVRICSFLKTFYYHKAGTEIHPYGRGLGLCNRCCIHPGSYKYHHW